MDLQTSNISVAGALDREFGCILRLFYVFFYMLGRRERTKDKRESKMLGQEMLELRDVDFACFPPCKDVLRSKQGGVVRIKPPQARLKMTVSKISMPRSKIALHFISHGNPLQLSGAMKPCL